MSGGAISRLPITITNPDPGVVIEPSALELANTLSLAAASVYHLGVSGEGMTIDMINRGITPDLIILDTGLADIKGLSGLARIHHVGGNGGWCWKQERLGTFQKILGLKPFTVPSR